ncbi:MAG TPA: LLM class F420-dependent oxidoreductase [Candidatus Binataceae bacterium]|nr:LLM class F420-dependent oxidoreductase [Candidatus Binataceae bacterium]
MEYGVILPHIGAYAREHVVERIRTVAQHAEKLGYHSIWAADHVVFPSRLVSKYPYHPEGKFPFDTAENFLEPLTVLTYAAACTSRVRLGTGVLIIPYRHPVVTAKVIATLDLLSGGRVIVGAGVGWLAEEFAFLDSPFKQRGARTDEYLQAMKALWTQPEASFDGRFVHFGDVRSEPKPVQKPHPPIWVGGHSAAALRRTAQLADGWYGHIFWRDPEAIVGEIRSIREMAAQNGRDPRTLTYAALNYEKSLDDVVQHIPSYERAGLDHIVLPFFGWTDRFDEVLELMFRFAREAGLAR